MLIGSPYRVPLVPQKLGQSAVVWLNAQADALRVNVNTTGTRIKILVGRRVVNFR